VTVYRWRERMGCQMSGLLNKTIKYAEQNGVKRTVRHIVKRINDVRACRAFHYSLIPDADKLKAERSFQFPEKIRISIITPVYNTDLALLQEMIESVLAQTYVNWELCLADGSDAQHAQTGDICREYAQKDSRIIYRKLEANTGISGNTNAGIAMSSGEYLALLDHDDMLHPSALFEVTQAICEQKADFIYTDETTFRNKPEDAYYPHLKPDYAPDTLRGNNYICHLTVFSRTLLNKTGMFRSCCDGSQDYDMILRLTEQAEKIVHIPQILYYWRAHQESVATDVSAKPYVIEAAHKALQDHLKRSGMNGTVENTAAPSIYRIRYALQAHPLVSIIIPNKDHVDDLKKCIESIRKKTTYNHYEILIVENNSTELETFAYYHEIEKIPYIRVADWPKNYFNYAEINNYGASLAEGEYFVLLNNDTEIITPDWIQEMLMYVQREDVGAAGAKLYYPDDTIQHAGIGVGLLTVAGHYHRHFTHTHPGYMGRLLYSQNVSAVTGACLMVRRNVWEQFGGLDESFAVAFNDVDLCMRIRQAGYLIVWTPYAELYHYESKSRGLEDTPEKQQRFAGEVQRFQQRWGAELTAGDPYYNPNLTLNREDFSLR